MDNNNNNNTTNENEHNIKKNKTNKTKQNNMLTRRTVKREKLVHGGPANGTIGFGHRGRNHRAFGVLQVAEQRLVHGHGVREGKVSGALKVVQTADQPVTHMPPLLLKLGV